MMKILLKKFVPNSPSGFTLIELMLVVAIIGILASIAVPKFSTYRDSAFVTEGFTLSRSLQNSIGEYYGHRGEFPSNNKAAGVPGAKSLYGKYVEQIEISDGAIHITYFDKYLFHESKAEQSADPPKLILSLRPAIIEDTHEVGSISWICGFAEPVERMVVSGENRTTINTTILPTLCL